MCAHTLAVACLWTSEDSLQEMVLSFYLWILGIELKWADLATSTFYLWSHTVNCSNLVLINSGQAFETAGGALQQKDDRAPFRSTAIS